MIIYLGVDLSSILINTRYRADGRFWSVDQIKVSTYDFLSCKTVLSAKARASSYQMIKGNDLPVLAFRVGGGAQILKNLLGGANGLRVSPIICFSHLRWGFVFQRPQHLMSRFSAQRPVWFWEEPERSGGEEASLRIVKDPSSNVQVITPLLPQGFGERADEAALELLLEGLLKETGAERPVLWYYTPMMLGFSQGVAARASAIVYDCMDELANFQFAPERLKELERELLDRADVVFTGGYSLYEAKRDRHANIHPFPSSVDVAHFAQARSSEVTDPADQAALPHPRLGFYGVLDERLDLGLVERLADAHPDWSIVMVGPVVKIDPAQLPKRTNIHYLGGKSYDQLPAYLSGWDVALMPFAINEATRFISPTKTPEYLAGGRPVVSTGITDVRRHYGETPGVFISDDTDGFIVGCETALALATGSGDGWLKAVDAELAKQSWNITQAEMATLIGAAEKRHRLTHPAISKPAVLTSGRRRHCDVLVVGAGFAGSVMAERLASSGRRVIIMDRRPHVGGNAYDALDDAGVRIHVYGPHIFHTNSDEVFSYLSRFTRWRPYEHRVLAQVGDKQVPMPINRTTLNRLYGLSLSTDQEAAAFLAARAEPRDPIRTSEDVVVSAVGHELYETFFQGYTRKQWGLDPSELDRAVTARVPTRTNTDDRYFTDKHQAMPADGYTAMFEAMLDHPNIEVLTGVDFDDVKDDILYDRLVFTGPVDAFFGRRYGPLPYRSLRFDHRTLDQAQYQDVAVVNYPREDVPYTRITEYKHLTGQTHAKTSITVEYPTSEGDPYYPIPTPEAQALYKRYEALALQRPDVDFIGRLATYRYYNMDQVVAQALSTFRKRFAQDVSPSVASRDALVAPTA